MHNLYFNLLMQELQNNFEHIAHLLGRDKNEVNFTPQEKQLEVKDSGIKSLYEESSFPFVYNISNSDSQFILLKHIKK